MLNLDFSGTPFKAQVLGPLPDLTRSLKELLTVAPLRARFSGLFHWQHLPILLLRGRRRASADGQLLDFCFYRLQISVNHCAFDSSGQLSNPA